MKGETKKRHAKNELEPMADAPQPMMQVQEEPLKRATPLPGRGSKDRAAATRRTALWNAIIGVMAVVIAVVIGLDKPSTVQLPKPLPEISHEEEQQSIAPSPSPLPQKITNSIGMEFVLIPAGTFIMGSLKSYDRHELAHPVTISQPYYMVQYEVTQAQWRAVMGNNPSHFKGDNLPVENVSWEDAQAFIQKLNEQEGVDLYRLPTEAQWEYAARAGSRTVYHFGNDAAQLDDYAWYDGSQRHPHPVGRKKPNTWGLYDMYGNVWEWVQDWKGLYSAGAITDPSGPDTGTFRVLRGGAWYHGSHRLTSRWGGRPDDSNIDTGFRCVRLAVSQ